MAEYFQQLKWERERHNWSQAEVAEKIGTTAPNVSRWERGITSPGPYFRQKLCDLYQKSPEALGFVQVDTDEMLTEPTSQDEDVPKEATAVVAVSTTSATHWCIPYRRNVFFTGREHILAHLDTALHGSKSAALTQAKAISGLGGVGKTQTALEYAYRHREEYQAVFWVRAESRDVLLSDAVAIAQSLNLAEKNEPDQQRIIEAVKQWLRTHTNWLFILDNVEDFAILDEILPVQSTGHILLTTRDQATGTFAERINVDSMEPEEGATFLLRRAKLLERGGLEMIPPAQYAVAKTISQLMDGLPLALDQAGAYIEETGCSLSGYLERMQTCLATLLKRRGNRSEHHQESVYATVSLAFEKVVQAHPAAADILRLCTFLYPDAIPEEIFTEGYFHLLPAPQPTTSRLFQFDEALAVLRTYSLVRRNPDAATVTVHRVVQAVLREHMDEPFCRRWATRAVLAVNAAFPESQQVETWPRCQRCLAHALTCIPLIESYAMLSPEAGRLMHQVAAYLFEHARYQEAERLFQQAIALRERVIGPDDPDTLLSLYGLGKSYRASGKYELAEGVLQRVYAVQERVLGADHEETAKSLDSLALLYWIEGKYALAEPLLQRVLAIRERVLGPDHLTTSNSLNNLAMLFGSLGKYALAEPLFQRALRIREQALGPEHLDTAHILNNLANLYHAEGNDTDAESLFHRALTIRRQVVGPDHPDTARILDNLALVYRSQGKYDLGEPLFLQALEIYEKALGPHHPLTSDSLNDLATLYRLQGRYALAEPLYQRALTIREQALGPEHPYTAETLYDFALLKQAQGEHEAAESLFLRTLAIREKVLSPDHPDLVATLECYTAFLTAVKRDAEATRVQERL